MTIEHKMTSPQNSFSLISDDKLLQLYATMLKCRMLEEHIRIILKRDQLEKLCDNGFGQEAAAAGVATGLGPGDTLAPSHRNFIPCFVKGLPLERILSSLSAGAARNRSAFARLNLIHPSLSLAAQLDRALRAAASNKASRNGKIAVAFSGGASNSSGLLQQAMSRAGALHLPILFVCRSGPKAEDFSLQARSFPGIPVDGNDVIAVYRVASEAIAHARRGNGPTLIECQPWPLPGPKETKKKSAQDSILNMEEYLLQKGLFARKFKAKVTAEFKLELDSAIAAAGSARPSRSAQ